MTGNNIVSNGRGVYCLGSAALIVGNRIADNTAVGIQCSMGACVAACNTITASKGIGVLFGYSFSAPYSKLINNTIVLRGTARGISCESGSGSPDIFNNIIAYGEYGVYVGGGTPILSHNDVYGSTRNSYYPTTLVHATDISAPPAFIDQVAGDYHLAEGSLCINAGSNSAPGLPLFDMDGEGRNFGGTVDIGADEYWARKMSISDVKVASDGAVIKGGDAVVTAAFDGFFYIESDDRSSGIRVNKMAHGIAPGTSADVMGKVGLTADGERCIIADTAASTGTETIAPVFMSNRVIGGGSIGSQEAVSSWQWGMDDSGNPILTWQPATGLNNTGLLVRVFGRVTQGDPSGNYFYIDDGSVLLDGTKTGADDNIGLRIAADGRVYPNGQLVAITGISSCFKGEDGKLRRLLRQRDDASIQRM